MLARIAALILVLLAQGLGTVSAEESRGYLLQDVKFQVYLGAFFPRVSSEIAINGEILPPEPEISLEEVFGLEDSKTLLWGGARWNIARRHILEFEFVNLNRSGTQGAVSEPIKIGDSIVAVGGQIDTRFDTTIARLTYGYSLIKKERADFQLKAGLHIANVETEIVMSGAACKVTDPNSPTCVIGSAPVKESEDITAPLPHLGLSFAYGITPSVAFRTQVIGFAIEINDFKGAIVEVDADLVWHPWQHFGIGAGVRYFDTSIEGTGSGLRGKFEFDYLGPVVYGLLSF